MKRRIAAVALVLALIFGIARAASPDVILGVLEESSGLYAGGANFFKVRMAFIKRDGQWRGWCTTDFCPEGSFPLLPEGTIWNVGFSGKYLDSIRQTRQAGLEWTLDNHHVPTIGKPSVEFGGFPGTVAHRPLVVSSRKQFADPDGWRPGQPSPLLVSSLRAEFRRKFPKVENCDHESDEEAKPWAYKNSNIRVKKFYAARNGWSVVMLELSPSRCGWPDDDAFEAQVYVVSPAGKIQYLDQGLWLVDAGDYDADGRSELVFSINRYDEGGYVLYYDSFARHVTAQFHYH